MLCMNRAMATMVQPPSKTIFLRPQFSRESQKISGQIGDVACHIIVHKELCVWRLLLPFASTCGAGFEYAIA